MPESNFKSPLFKQQKKKKYLPKTNYPPPIIDGINPSPIDVGDHVVTGYEKENITNNTSPRDTLEKLASPTEDKKIDQIKK